jgi:O-acetyl-ADP-ribose deacetylase (regulator of RNase III)
VQTQTNGSSIKFNDRLIKIIQGDITELEADALVNAANNQLWMGGGVAGALKRRGGKIIEAEAVSKGPIPIGEAVITTAGALSAKAVIHTAGMGTDLRTDADKIRNATYNALKRASEANFKSIAFPSIGTGVGGFPVKEAAAIMLNTTIVFLKNNLRTSIKKIIFVLYDRNAHSAFATELENIREKENSN